MAFLAFVGMTSIALAVAIGRECLAQTASGAGFQERVHRLALESVPLKYRFVDLSGGYARLAGFRICNQRMRYRNGMQGLPYKKSKAGCPPLARGELTNLVERLSMKHTPFLFTLAPCKIDLEGRLFPEGWEGDNPNRRAESAAAALAERGVRVLDLVPRLTATPEDVGRNFFFTDHHWNYRAALQATDLICSELSDMLGCPALKHPDQLRPENWKWQTRRRFFLGSHGRRTGCLFGGLSDFEYGVPRFKSFLERTVPSRRIRKEGDFVKAETVASALKKADPHAVNRYAFYTGPDVGLQIHRNFRAPFPHRVMLVKDSFGDPVAAFLATLFKTVAQVDPRQLSNGETVLDLVERFRPDAVVWLANPSTLLAQRGN